MKEKNRESITFVDIKVLNKKTEITYKDGEYYLPDAIIPFDSKKAIHPDFKNALNRLIPFLAEMFHIADGFEDKIEVKGIKLDGEENENVIIGFMLTDIKGRQASINTCKINMIDDVYGFEEGLEDAVNEIENEAFNLIFKNKALQAEMDFQHQTTEEVHDKISGDSKKENKESIKTVGPGNSEQYGDKDSNIPDNNINGRTIPGTNPNEDDIDDEDNS